MAAEGDQFKGALPRISPPSQTVIESACLGQKISGSQLRDYKWLKSTEQQITDTVNLVKAKGNREKGYLTDEEFENIVREVLKI